MQAASHGGAGRTPLPRCGGVEPVRRRWGEHAPWRRRRASASPFPVRWRGGAPQASAPWPQNSDAAYLAETLIQNNCKTKVVGVPVSLNGDLKNQFVETTVGFDTVCKVNSQLVSNVCLDAISAGKVNSAHICTSSTWLAIALIFVEISCHFFIIEQCPCTMYENYREIRCKVVDKLLVKIS